MSDKPENPRAFPDPQRARIPPSASTGMTLRDYFAGQALMGRVSTGKDGLFRDVDREFIAEASYKMADVAKDLGVVFHYLPITPGEPFAAQAEALAQVVARQGAKVLAYCRSGARASNAWSLAQEIARADHRHAH